MTLRLLPAPADIFESSADAVVIPVNCIGVPGKGLALAAAKRWPEWAATYKADCRSGDVRPGVVHCNLVRGAELPLPHFFLSAGVKNHWRARSRISWVKECFRSLVWWCEGATDGAPPDMLRTVAVPALGCGLGELNWNDVRPLAEKILRVPGVEFLLYAPHEAQRPSAARRG